MAKFVYNVNRLIEEVEERPCLWDKTLDIYKDSTQKRNNWAEVAAWLDNEFQLKTEIVQQTILDNIMAKWKNIRDAFSRALKKSSGQGCRPKYKYFDQLTFLRKIIESDTTESSLFGEQEEYEEVDLTDIEQTSAPTKAHKNKRSKDDDFESEILTVLRKKTNPPKPLDEDELFFASVLPKVRAMTEYDNLEFKVGVMRLIQSIGRQANMPQSSVSPSHPSTPS